MAVYITEKERTALLDASDFIATHADGAIDYSSFEEMQHQLNKLFKKAKDDSEKIRMKRLVKKYVRQGKHLLNTPSGK